MSAILFLSLMLLGLGLLSLLWNYLAEYEKSTPRYIGEQILECYRSGDFKAAMELVGVDPAQFYDSEQYPRYMQGVLGDFNAVRIAESGEEKGHKVLLLLGENGKSVRYLLSESPEPLRYGLCGFTAKQEPVPVKGVTIHAPSHVEVTVNGQPLPAESRVGETPVEGFPMDTSLGNDSAKNGSMVPLEETYRVEGFAVDPELGLAGKAPEEYRLERNGAEAAFTLIPPEKQEYEQLAVTVSKLYARFISRDAELSALTSYLYPGTSFYNTVRNFDNNWYNSHNGVEFANLKAENTVSYSPDHFSTEVSFDYIVYRGSASNRWGEWSYPTRYRLYFLRTGNGWKVLEIQGL